MEELKIKLPMDKKEYAKMYYAENKKKMTEQIKKAVLSDESIERKKKKAIDKLNINGFKRIPMRTLKKYDIIFDENLKKYI